jgi:hypothetical protein
MLHKNTGKKVISKKKLFQSHIVKDNVTKGSFSLTVLFWIFFVILFLFLFFSTIFIFPLNLNKNVVALIYSEIALTKNNPQGIGFAEKNILQKRVMANYVTSGMDLYGFFNDYSIPRLVFDGDSKIALVVFHGE